MSRSTPIRLAALAVMLFALTLLTARVVRDQPAPSAAALEHQVAMSEITVPVEIIEVGEDPAVLEIRVQP